MWEIYFNTLPQAGLRRGLEVDHVFLLKKYYVSLASNSGPLVSRIILSCIYKQVHPKTYIDAERRAIYFYIRVHNKC